MVEYDAHETYLIMCAASHLGMHFDAGYVWFLNPLLSDQWWLKFINPQSECTSSQMINITSWTFVVGHQLLTAPMVHSFITLTGVDLNGTLNVSEQVNDSSGKHNVDGEEYYRRQRRSKDIVKNHVFNNNLSNNNINFYYTKSKLAKSPMKDYLIYTYDAVVLLASAVVHLLRENPAAVSALNQPKIAKALRNLVAQTDFGYRFHQKSADGGGISNFKFPIEVFTSDAGFQSVGDYYGIRNQLPASASNLRFNKNNERVADYWLLKQRQLNITVPIIMWSAKVNQSAMDILHGNVTNNISEHSVSGDLESSKLVSLTLMYDQFQDRMIEHRLDYVNWSSLGGPPPDGSISANDCMFAFLSVSLGKWCKTFTVLFYAIITVAILLPAILGFHFYYRCKLKEVEKKTRKPFEELCAELTDLIVS